MRSERFLENSIIINDNIKIYRGNDLIYSGPANCVKVRLATWGSSEPLSDWFDDKLMGGEFDEEYYLPDDMVEELLIICKNIISNPKKAKKLLPGYIKEYYSDIVSAKEILEKTFKSEDTDFRYIVTSY